MTKTRLAPSPSGALHLGNARTFLLNWLLAKQNGWAILLRIEDLDGPRIKAGADQLLLQDLKWIGLTWDEGPIYQSQRAAIYRSAIDYLLKIGLAYPCICTRGEVELAASAPHAEDGAAVYPGTCRGRFASVQEAAATAGRLPAIRFAAPDRAVEFNDLFRGRQKINVAAQLGDFVISKSDGTAAYQLAVVVDDLAANITQIVRGDDLLDSTPRQILLYEALRAADQIPRYIHLPLVTGQDGRRLAKRHGDTRLATYRQAGVPAGRVLALLARWSGIAESIENVSDPAQLIDTFHLQNLPRAPIIFTAADDHWLNQQCA
ncbi:MAG: tRNA glutamyl-Q(34) synthetase GluQRS [Planctomycetota bacterium]|nr:tRNA glutamyl-Q(34) synthetase GluQRS [Planctomycetota bacterium]